MRLSDLARGKSADLRIQAAVDLVRDAAKEI